MTSTGVMESIKEALKKGEEKHFEILYYRKDGKCSFVEEVEPGYFQSGAGAKSARALLYSLGFPRYGNPLPKLLILSMLCEEFN